MLIPVENIRVRYDKIYLVAVDFCTGSKHRVTKRPPNGGRPGELIFISLRADEKGEPMGTLEFDQAQYAAWFDHYGEYLSGMESAEAAAEMIIRTNPTIFYGCPLGHYRTKRRNDSRRHIEEHVGAIVRQFDLVMEVEDGSDTQVRTRQAKRSDKHGHADD